jgi:hypothetical protein
MNRYRGGSSSVASRVELAHTLAQLKAENPVPLRTICDFDLLPFSRGITTSVAMIICPKALIKLD